MEENKNYEFHAGFKFLFENGMYAIGWAFWDNSGEPPWLLGFTNMKKPEDLRRLLPKKTSNPERVRRVKSVKK
ncbi:MAG: hypothetical protein WC741_00550 [Patescibacteria group bacterium]|jgi:hypothetical protein